MDRRTENQTPISHLAKADVTIKLGPVVQSILSLTNSLVKDLLSSVEKYKIKCANIFALNPIALRKAKIVCNFGLSKCNRVNKNSAECGVSPACPFS